MSGIRPQALDRMIEAHESELWLPLPHDEDEVEEYYRALKTAMLLTDWTDELPDAKICERYGVGPGDIYGMVESINWLLHASAEPLPDVCCKVQSQGPRIRDLHEERYQARVAPARETAGHR